MPAVSNRLILSDSCTTSVLFGLRKQSENRAAFAGFYMRMIPFDRARPPEKLVVEGYGPLRRGVPIRLFLEVSL